jgi:hypothetical protein
MLFKSYVENCEKVLAAFETTQAKMLHLDLNNAGREFQKQMKTMIRLLKQISAELEKYSFRNHNDKVLITKQIERLMIFLKEMEVHLRGLNTKPPPNENEIIFIFERQHVFKNIYRKHLVDIAAIIN